SASASSCASSRTRATIKSRFIASSSVGLAQPARGRAACHRGGVRSALRVFRRSALEDHEQAEVLVGGEAVLRAGLDEHGAAFAHRPFLALDLEHAAAFEDDVELVAVVRLVAVGLGCNEDVDTELEAGGLVNDLVASSGLGKPLSDSGYLECMHVQDATSR